MSLFLNLFSCASGGFIKISPNLNRKISGNNAVFNFSQASNVLLLNRSEGGRAYFESSKNNVETEAKAHISTGFPGEFALRCSMAGRLKFSLC